MIQEIVAQGVFSSFPDTSGFVVEKARGCVVTREAAGEFQIVTDIAVSSGDLGCAIAVGGTQSIAWNLDQVDDNTLSITTFANTESPNVPVDNLVCRFVVYRILGGGTGGG